MYWLFWSKPLMYDREPDIEARTRIEQVSATPLPNFDHLARLDIQPIGDPVGHAAGIHLELLADDELSQHDEGERCVQC